MAITVPAEGYGTYLEARWELAIKMAELYVAMSAERPFKWIPNMHKRALAHRERLILGLWKWRYDTARDIARGRARDAARATKT